MNCGEKIAELRKKSGMTQDDLGKAMNVSYQAVSKWERGESQPDFNTMSKIAKLFNVPLAYFEEDGQLQGEEAYPEEQKSEESKQEAFIGVCTVCGKMLREGEVAETYPKIVCEDCVERQTREAQRRREQEKAHARFQREREAEEVIGHGFDATLIVSLVLALAGYIGFAVLAFINLSSDDAYLYGTILFFLPLMIFACTHSITDSINELRNKDDDASYKLTLSLIIGAVFAVINIALFLVLYLLDGSDGNFFFLIFMIGGAILSFAFVSQFLWGGSIKDVYTAGGFTFKLPGFIITLSIESVLWMIVAKFFLGILAAIVFVVTTVLVAVVAIAAAPFFFIPCILLKVGRDRKARASLKE